MKNNRNYEQVDEGGFDNDLSFNVREVIAKYLYHWPLFLVCIGLGLCIAFAYLRYTKPIYVIQAKMMVVDEPTPADNLALKEIDAPKTPFLVENEIESLQSKDLMKFVVQDMELWANYERIGNFATNNLYNTGPIKFNLLEQKGKIGGQIINLTIKDENSFEITTPDEQQEVYFFNSTFKSPLGVWKLEKTGSFKDFIGQTIRIKLTDPEQVASSYRGNMSVYMAGEASPIIMLSMSDEVADRGVDVLNHLIDAYKINSIRDQNRISESTLKFLDDRLASLSGELTSVEKNVEGFKSSRGLTDISSESQSYLANVQSNDSRLNEVNIQLNVIEGIEKYINSAQSNQNPPATIGITDPGFSSLVEELTRLQIQRDKLLATAPEGNPIFIPINRQIKTLKLAIQDKLINIKSSLLATKQKLQSYTTVAENSIKRLPGQERQYVSIKRQQTIKENLYVYLLQKREEVAVNNSPKLAKARVIEDATYLYPQSPNKKSAIILIVVVGIILPAAFIFLRDLFKGKILNRQEIEKSTFVPVISEFIYQKNSSPKMMINRTDYALGEQLRELRAKLQYIYDKNAKGRVTLFTSSIPSEGKSFVVSNLGATLAASGRKTIILELDLRRPQITKIFDLVQSHPGLSNYLSGEVSEHEIVQFSGLHDNLNIMGSGTIPMNPSELLETQRMEDLLNHLRTVYDDILIDSPPLHLVADAMILAEMADATMYVVRQGFTSKSELNFIKQIQKDQALPKLNIIFNGVKNGKYGYGYNYNYTYYNNEKKKSVLGTITTNFSSRF